MSDKTIADYCVSYTMKCGAFNPTKQSKEVKQATADKFGCPANQTTGTVYLVLKEYTEPITKKVAKIRRFYDFHTLKLKTLTIIPSNNFWTVADFNQIEIPSFDELKEDFVTRWEPEIRPRSIEKLQKLGYIFDHAKVAAYQLSAEEVRDERIYFEFGATPLGSPDIYNTMTGLTDDLRIGMKSELEIEYAEVERQANEEIEARLERVLIDFTTKMNTYKEGSKQRIHESIVGNIGELVSVLPNLLVGENSKIVELCEEATMLTNWDVDLLKENESCRKEASAEAQKLIDRLRL